ncbi:hypothetical protein K450DRAFT_235400 [Umbelopsis ramanniana AG]|uniref:Uncharacterized protein n=1 Tax=Umbelopsis ramanniana AG TaxID=1314678 RepID=A0AAD5HFQ7_UMBRA|nr:uncharacterized protein K450DRAFT_235400 [Umbelopsis ramanniana AG]KAI8580951.1 hypothetical protein K450DRAFT_235400 [Umbelopsis ramanniana AG]
MGLGKERRMQNMESFIFVLISSFLSCGRRLFSFIFDPLRASSRYSPDLIRLHLRVSS